MAVLPSGIHHQNYQSDSQQITTTNHPSGQYILVQRAVPENPVPRASSAPPAPPAQTQVRFDVFVRYEFDFQILFLNQQQTIATTHAQMGSRGRPASVDVDPQNESMQEVQHIVESNASTQAITRKVPSQGN